MSGKKPSASSSPQTVRQRVVWRGIAFLSLMTLLVLVLLMWGALWLQEGRWNFWANKGPLASTYYDDARTVVTLVGALALGVTIWTSVRTQGANEEKFEQEKRDRDTETARERAQDRRARFSAGSQNLSSESPAARIAAVYTIATLADEFGVESDSGSQQNCIDVLCAYLRMTSRPKTVLLDTPALPGTSAEDGARVRAEDEIWRTIFSVIRQRCAEDAARETSWSSLQFNFRGIHFADADLSGICLRHGGSLDFTETTISGRLSLADGVWLAGEIAFVDARFLSGSQLDISRVLIRGGSLRAYISSLSESRISAAALVLESGSIRIVAKEVSASQLSFERAQFNGGSCVLELRLRKHAHLRLQTVKVTAMLHLKLNVRETSSVRMHRPILAGNGAIRFERTVLQPGATVTVEKPGGSIAGHIDIDKPQFNGGVLSLRGLDRNAGPQVTIGGSRVENVDSDLRSNSDR